jgi:hypothetical protein
LAAKTRALTPAEITEAQSVFQDTIDYSQVVIADALGYDDRPFTFVCSAKFALGDTYILFMGPSVFAGMGASDWPTFIHEMTHVWQGQNHVISSGYMLNSVVSQAIDGSSAYDYKVGDFWGEYNVEQQAHLVEDWYELEGKSITGSRYPYIKNDIRTPIRAWTSDLFIGIAAGAAAVKG